MVGNVTSDGNRVIDLGDFGVREMQQTLAAMHDLTAKRGYLDLDLDFSRCTSAFSGQMLGLAAQRAKLPHR